MDPVSNVDVERHGSRAGWPLRILSALAVVSLFVLIFMITLDALGRYFFAAPIRGSLEVTAMLMCAIIFAVLPLVCFRRGHITIDLLDHFVGRRIGRVRDAFVSLVCAGFFGLVAWRMTEYGLKLESYGDHSLLLKIPLYPASFFIALSAAVSTVILVIDAFRPAPSSRG